MKKQRAFLKWAGGKYSLVEPILSLLPKRADVLVEPFVGAGSVFLNSHYKKFILNDINPDLIALYQHLQQQPENLIAETQKLFTEKYNQEDAYYEIRKSFNQEKNSFNRSILFIYLNRHGYNGLCRYNLSGGFNVPFGRYVKAYFPEEEMRFFSQKSQNAEFTCVDFETCMSSAPKGAVIYCDPPYVSLSDTAKFTQYAAKGFSAADQQRLADTAHHLADKQLNNVLISNHDTPQSQQLYRHAKVSKHKVARMISRDTLKRNAVNEVLALYKVKR